MGTAIFDDIVGELPFVEEIIALPLGSACGGDPKKEKAPGKAGALDVMKSYSEHIRLNGMSIEHGLVPVVAADGNDVRCARRAKGILHTLGNARIVAQQDTGEE